MRELNPAEVGVTIQMSLEGVINMREVIIFARDIMSGKEHPELPHVSLDELNLFIDNMNTLIKEGDDYRSDHPTEAEREQ